MNDTATGFAPAIPDWRERVEATFAAQGFAALIGMRIVEIAPGRVVLDIDVDDRLGQHHGFVHAGVTTTLADNAGGFAAFTLFPAGTQVLTVSFTVNFLAPARGERLIAEARVVKPGRTLTVCVVDVSAEQGGTRTAIAKMQQTLMSVSASTP